MLQDRSDDERVERRLVVPDLSVEFEAFEAKGGFGEVETFVSADLNCGSERKRAFERNVSRQKQCQSKGRLIARASPSAGTRRL